MSKRYLLYLHVFDQKGSKCGARSRHLNLSNRRAHSEGCSIYATSYILRNGLFLLLLLSRRRRSNALELFLANGLFLNSLLCVFTPLLHLNALKTWKTLTWRREREEIRESPVAPSLASGRSRGFFGENGA